MLAEFHLITLHRERPVGDNALERQILCLRGGLHILHRAEKRSLEVERLLFEMHSARLQIGRVEDIHDGVDAFLRIGEREARHRLQLPGHGAVIPLDDRRERGFVFREMAFHLMAYEVEQFLLLLVRSRELFEVLDLFEYYHTHILGMRNAFHLGVFIARAGRLDLYSAVV